MNAFCKSLLVMLAAACVCGWSHAAPQSSAFAYQGYVEQDGAPVDGTRTLVFRLFDSASGGSQIGPAVTVPNVPIVDGLFVTELTFASAFNGQQRYLEISVDGETLAPRQAILAVPVAHYALAAPAVPSTASLSCTTVMSAYSGVFNLSCPANHTVVSASCNDGLATVFKDSSMPPLTGTLTWYLTPNAANATGVRCHMPQGTSHALLRCCRVVN